MPSDVATQAHNNSGVGNMWYSFDHGMHSPMDSFDVALFADFTKGMAHFVMLDMETDYAGYPEESFDPIQFGEYLGQQQDWLAADLAAVDRLVTPWVIVFGHRQVGISKNEPFWLGFRLA
jgi:hypothetical protein